MINISSAGAVTFKTPLGRTTKFRDSIRVNSKKIYNLDATTTGLLFVFDVQHAPVAYGAWPALWMVGEAGGGSYAWPKNGEVRPRTRCSSALLPLTAHVTDRYHRDGARLDRQYFVCSHRCRVHDANDGIQL